jgi:hypothetical protein
VIDNDEPQNVSTVNWPKKTVQQFDEAYRKAGYRSRAHYFDVVGLTLIQQLQAGERLHFPARLQLEEPLSLKKSRPPTKRKRPKLKQPSE